MAYILLFYCALANCPASAIAVPTKPDGSDLHFTSLLACHKYIENWSAFTRPTLPPGVSLQCMPG